MKTAREIIAAALCMNRFGFEIIESEREEADAILAALAAEGFSIVETKTLTAAQSLASLNAEVSDALSRPTREGKTG